MSNLCIIPARGGSKRIPRKNVKPFLGKPMLAYSIEAAKATGLFDEIMVSTDDEEIAEVAIRYGAKVPFMRSAKTASDYATTVDVLKEVIAKYQELGLYFENFCCLYVRGIIKRYITTVKIMIARPVFGIPILSSTQKTPSSIYPSMIAKGLSIPPCCVSSI